MFACEISLILLCIFETIYAVLLLRVGCVVVHLCDHYYSYVRIGGLRQPSALCSVCFLLSVLGFEWKESGNARALYSSASGPRRQNSGL